MKPEIFVRNIPQHQYDWIVKKAKQNGSNMSVVIKMLIQAEVEKEENMKALQKEYGVK